MSEAGAALSGRDARRALTPKGLAMRERLLDAAGQAFADYGYERARVSDIVAIAGTSHGNFYRHFRDKPAILMAVLERLYVTLSRATNRAPGTADVPTEPELVRRNAAFFHLYADHRDLLRVAREAAAAGEHGGFLDSWLRIRRIFIDRNARWIARLQAEGKVSVAVKPELMAEALGALTEQLAYVEVGLARVRPRPERLDELGRVCGIVWHRTLFGAAAGPGR